MFRISAQLDPPPRPPCDDCMDAVRCVMRGALCRELICAWLQDQPLRGCEFHTPDNYHGLEGVRV